MTELHLYVEIADAFLGGQRVSARVEMTAAELDEGPLPVREIVRRRLHQLVDELADGHIPGGTK